MPTYIIHKDGAYNLFSTVSDGCHYESALTLEQLREALPGDIDERLARAHKTGCSGIGHSLEDCISGNRAGQGEAELPADEFIRRFLTLATPSPAPAQTADRLLDAFMHACSNSDVGARDMVRAELRALLAGASGARAGDGNLEADARGYATRLAESIFDQHFASDPCYASGEVVWRPCDDLMGVLTQIDNMVSGLERVAAAPAVPAHEVGAGEKWEADVECITDESGTDYSVSIRGPGLRNPDYSDVWIKKRPAELLAKWLNKSVLPRFSAPAAPAVSEPAVDDDFRKEFAKARDLLSRIYTAYPETRTMLQVAFSTWLSWSLASPPEPVPAEYLPTKEHIVELAEEALDEIMEQAQVLASAWSLVGGKFDDGNALSDAEDARAELRTMVRSLADLAAETVRPAVPFADGENPCVLEWGAVSLPLGDPSRVTEMKLCATLWEAIAEGALCGFDWRVYPMADITNPGAFQAPGAAQETQP